MVQMLKVLVVDDEPQYCELLKRGLAHDGHEVLTATSGREAIEAGVRLHPDVVVTDWMLRNHLNGVHIVNLMQAVFPRIRSIVMTGFPSDDLRNETQEARVCDFIEKPFELDRIRSAVRRAGASERRGEGAVPLAVVEVEADGRITFASPRARELFSGIQAGPEAKSLEDLFTPEGMPDLDAATAHWIEVCPRAQRPVVWRMRTGRPRETGSRLAVLRGQQDPQYLGNRLIEMLLGIKDPQRERWPFEGRVLVIDKDALVRKVSVDAFESVGAACVAASSVVEAQRLLEADGGVFLVVLDLDIGDSARTAIERIRAARPGATIVGTGDAPRKLHADAMAVQHYLEKPWAIDDLINVLTGRLGSCVECGLAMPLRKATDGEQASSWECAFCGARYRAVFDSDISSGISRNVRRVELPQA